MERTINTLWGFCGDFSMITLAEKLIIGSGTGELEVKGYVEFVSSTPMTISPKYTNSGVTLQYSLDGTSWTPIVSGSATPSANIIYFRGQATETKSLFVSTETTNAWAFTGATNLECNGKLDRLIQDTLGNDNDILVIGSYCYSYMFYNNATLITAPSLPTTALATYCYANMFQGCTNLTTAPTLPATALVMRCYYAMFNGCTNLTTAPTLPATVLSPFCYANMFTGCTNLVTLPKLPATVLQANCYFLMFQGCTKIKMSTTINISYVTAYRIPTTGTGTTASNALVNMFAATGGTFTGTPTINTTYYTENTPV